MGVLTDLTQQQLRTQQALSRNPAIGERGTFSIQPYYNPVDYGGLFSNPKQLASDVKKTRTPSGGNSTPTYAGENPFVKAVNDTKSRAPASMREDIALANRKPPSALLPSTGNAGEGWGAMIPWPTITAENPALLPTFGPQTAMAYGPEAPVNPAAAAAAGAAAGQPPQTTWLQDLMVGLTGLLGGTNKPQMSLLPTSNRAPGTPIPVLKSDNPAAAKAKAAGQRSYAASPGNYMPTTSMSGGSRRTYGDTPSSDNGGNPSWW
jgi:hypothetical protein